MGERPVGYYSNREERAEFIAVNLAPFLSGSVLDVGCGEAYLRAHVRHYIGVDLVGEPDVIVDLERAGLPFRDRSFDSVVCVHVLEHLDSLREIAADLFRVAGRHVVVSVPNMYALGYRLKFLRGQVIGKEYSLMPRNRHKWLPSWSEARAFLRDTCPEGWSVSWEFAYRPRAWWRVGPIYNLLACRYPNLLATGYWCVMGSERR